MTDYSTEQNFRLAQELLKRQGEINALRNELTAARRAQTAVVDERDALKAELDGARAAIERTKAKHYRTDDADGRPYCRECDHTWPCPTLATLDAPQRPEDTETAGDEDDARWRQDERGIDGGFSGSEFPRLWPPRQRPEDTREETGRG